MAEIAKPARAVTLSSIELAHNCRQSGLICGEDIAAGDLVYVKSDGKVWRANGTAANAAARVRGVAAIAAHVAQNDGVTILHNCEIAWNGHLQALGADLYLSSAVPGGFSTTATVGGANPIGYVKDLNHFFVFSPN